MYSKCFQNDLLLVIFVSVISLINLALAEEFKQKQGDYLGCFKEISATARLLTDDYQLFYKKNTPQVCIQHCRKLGFGYAGLEYFYECFCNKKRPSFIYATEENECNAPCEGDTSKICGAKDRISLYEAFEIQSNPVQQNYIGCVDVSDKKLYKVAPTINVKLTPEKCVADCFHRGFRFAVLRNRECFCGDTINEDSQVADECFTHCENGVCEDSEYSFIQRTLVAENECNEDCENDKYKCGGKVKSSVYTTGITAFSENDRLIGCYKDDDAKLLSGYFLKFIDKNSPKLCLNLCHGIGFKYAGVRAGVECFCGNVKPDDKVRSTENECAMPCPGEGNKLCGGQGRIFVLSAEELHHRLTKRSTKDCIGSTSEVTGSKTCEDDLLFEEDFSNEISPRKWRYEVKMPWTPDYEFVILNKDKETVFVRGGKLFIKPILLEEEFVQRGHIKLDGCTGARFTEECERQAVGFNILPPIKSGKITTKERFSFKYGKIQIRAKLPKGDWIIPEIWLEPKINIYGPHLASGRIRIAMARGNSELVAERKLIGSKHLECGVLMGVDENIKSKTVTTSSSNDDWHNEFHNYTLIWTPENLIFFVDNDRVGSLVNKDQTLCDSMGFDQNAAARWKSGSKIAPFDQEFYISLGLSAGGIREFPDNSVSGNNPKPWNNFAVKGMLNFWKDRHNWFKTWDGDNSALQIEHIRVTAI